MYDTYGSIDPIQHQTLQTQTKSQSVVTTQPQKPILRDISTTLCALEGTNTIANTNDKKKNKQTYINPYSLYNYEARCIIGTGSFGTVYQAIVQETKEIVAVKKVYQDKQYKNRELAIMSTLSHPCIVQLKYCFFSHASNDTSRIYLNLVMEYIPDTVYHAIRTHVKNNTYIQMIHVRCYMYQLCRSLAYIHYKGICHRDIKPHNIQLDIQNHQIRLCDFGSAKHLIANEQSISYICSRFYRAPELVCGAIKYTNAIDIWSLGCVLGELLCGAPLFGGDHADGQLAEIAQILGTPTREELYAMNPIYNDNDACKKILNINLKRIPWKNFLPPYVPDDAIDLLESFLQYNPSSRITAFQALAHPFFDELRDVNLPSIYTNIHNYTRLELVMIRNLHLVDELLPLHIYRKLSQDDLEVLSNKTG